MGTLKKINNSPNKTTKILLAPLDWGLGHATRCIPIVKELLNRECEVIIAVSGDQRVLLEAEFPFLRFVDLPGYGIKYGKNRFSTLLKILGSIPKILIRIKREKAWLQQFLAQEEPDAIISDNRYGLYAPGVYSVFITHQLRILTPFGSLGDELLQRIHYRAIRRFSSCWIVDLEGAGGLAGSLSHPRRLPPVPTRYIGLLSRLERLAEAGGAIRTAGGEGHGKGLAEGGEILEAGVSAGGMPVEGVGMGELRATGGKGLSERGAVAGGELVNDGVACDLLVLLSGPEPQRTIFERMVLDQLASYSGKTILVRGLPGAGTYPGARPVEPEIGGESSGAVESASVRPFADGGGNSLPVGVRVYNHLPAKLLNTVMNASGIVVCRAGYSTIMDLVKLGKKAILVPTPGQTEQEYLGDYLFGKGMALCSHQSGFSLSGSMAMARDFPFTGLVREGAMGSDELLSAAVQSLLKSF